SPGNSTTPSLITFVGSLAGVPDALGTFTVVVRDLANNPLKNASVVIDLSGCTDLAICSDQLDAAETVNCVAKTLRKFTDLAGSTSFTVLGGAFGVGHAESFPRSGRLYANGTLLRAPSVASLDLDGSNGVGINDLSVWLTDFASGQPYSRSD